MLRTNNKKVNEYFKSIIIQSLEENELNGYIEQWNDLAINDLNFRCNNMIEFIANYFGGIALSLVGIMKCEKP